MRIFHGASDLESAVTILRDAGVEFAPPRKIRRTWLDTFDRRLFRADQRLEFVEGRERGAVLSQADTPPAQVALDEPPGFAEDIPFGPFRERLASVVAPRALLPLAVLEATARVGGKTGRDGKTVARVTVLDSLALDGQPSPSVTWAIEIDPVLGYDAADDLNRAMDRAGVASGPGDAFDLAMALHLVAPMPSTPRKRVALSGTEPAIEAFRRVLLNLLDTIELNIDGAINNVDPEFLHDLRIATRRTRSVLANAKKVIPSEVLDRFRSDFQRLAAATSEPRDLDVMILGWDGSVAAVSDAARCALEPVHRELIKRQRAAHAALSKTLKAQWVGRSLRDWREWLQSDDSPASGPALRSMRRVATKRLRRARRRLRGNLTATADERHAMRKEAKQLRYLIDCFGDLYDPAARKSFTKKLTSMQDQLGKAQDANAQIVILNAIASGLNSKPDTLRAIGELCAVLERRRSAGVSSTEQVFSKAADKRFRALLDSVR